MPQAPGPDRRRYFEVSITTATKGTTKHSIFALSAAGARRAARAFATAYGHLDSEPRTVTMIDDVPEG